MIVLNKVKLLKRINSKWLTREWDITDFESLQTLNDVTMLLDDWSLWKSSNDNLGLDPFNGLERVYILFLDGIPQYVGVSHNLSRRMFQHLEASGKRDRLHKEENKKKFDEFIYFDVPNFKHLKKFQNTIEKEIMERYALNRDSWGGRLKKKWKQPNFVRTIIDRMDSVTEVLRLNLEII